MRIKNKTNNLILWLPVVLWAVIIYLFSSISTIKVTEVFVWDFVSKKSAHVIEFAILFALLYKATKGKILISFIISLTYAASDEYHQSFVAGRSASLVDMAIDLSGINIAAYALWRLNRPRFKKH